MRACNFSIGHVQVMPFAERLSVAIERVRRDKAAVKAAKLQREAERRRSLELQEEAVQHSQRENSGCEGILIVSLLAAGPTALLPLGMHAAYCLLLVHMGANEAMHVASMMPSESA